MSARSNALGELTRFLLQARQGCPIDESVAMRVPYGNSDIDLVAVRPVVSGMNAGASDTIDSLVPLRRFHHGEQRVADALSSLPV
jgi:hypothetical protein